MLDNVFTAGWFTPLWTTIAGGVVVVVFQRTYKGIGKWQESRRTVEEKDRKLLYEMRDVLMDRPAGMFTKASKGLVSQVSELSDQVQSVDSKVDQVLDRLPQLSSD